jgi:hypothetical protein
MLFTENLTEAEAALARDYIEKHEAALKDCESDSLKQAYLQGVLDAEHMEKNGRPGSVGLRPPLREAVTADSGCVTHSLAGRPCASRNRIEGGQTKVLCPF